MTNDVITRLAAANPVPGATPLRPPAPLRIRRLVVAAVVSQARLAYEGRLFRVLGGAFAMLLNPFRAPEKRKVAPAETMVWFRLGPAIFAASLLVLGVHVFEVAPP